LKSLIGKKLGIYKITNLQNKKVYIGSSADVTSRRATHFRDLKNNKHVNKHLQRAYNKYGKDNFEWEILEHIKDLDDLLKREQYYIDEYSACNRDKGYNILTIAGSTLGRKLSAEAKLKMSISKKGRVLSDETKKKLSTAHKGNTHTEETKNKMSMLRKGKKFGPMSEETKKKISGHANCRLQLGKKRPDISKIILNISTGEVFNSIKDASVKYNIFLGSICKVCKGRQKTAGGYKWAYVIEEKDN